jgi:transcription termination factor NusB
MGKGSHQSKQKQQTSKSDSQTEATDTRQVFLTLEQASIFKQLIQGVNEAQAQLNFAITSAGLSNESIVGGQLEGEKPFFLVEQQPDD